MRKLFFLSILLSSALFAASSDENIISFEQKRITQNPNVKIKDIKISTKKELPCAGGAGATPPPPVRPPRRWSFAGWALALALLDQGVKAYIVTHFAVGESKPFLPQLLRLHYVRNFGAAWSSFSGERWLLIGVTGVGMLALAWLRNLSFAAAPTPASF